MNAQSQLEQAVSYLRREAKGLEPSLGLVLGSGLGGLAEHLEAELSVDYEAIPGFPQSTVEGHSGKLLIGRWAGVRVAVMQGRVHLYEGYPPGEVVLPVRSLIRLGASRLILTNAAGSVNPNYRPGDLMLLEDHLNLTGQSPLLGPNPSMLGPRFPDMTEVYCRRFRSLAHEASCRLGFQLEEGVYAGMLGPSYETPAEIRMLGHLGADAVGMSTVHEAIAARHMGAKLLAISCITNPGAGLGSAPLDHAEVKEVAGRVSGRMLKLLSEIVPRIAEDS